VSRATAMLDTLLHTSVNVTGMAAMFKVSRVTLFRAFRERLGLGPMEYLAQARLRRAGELLRHTDQPLAAVARGGESLYDQDLGGRLAWLFGNEGRGLSPGLESVASKRVRIPMAPGNESLNVAAAAAICLFEEVRQKRGRMPDTQSWR